MLSLRLNSGFIVQLRGVVQTETYMNYFEGSVGVINAHLLDRIEKEAKRYWGEGPVVILNEAFFRATLSRRIPMVCCIGLFECGSPVKNMDMMGSGLSVCWFEDAIEPHLSEENEKLLVDIDWRLLARDFDF